MESSKNTGHWWSQNGIIFTHTQAKKFSLVSLQKWGIPLKENNAPRWMQFLSFKSSPYFGSDKCFLWEWSLLYRSKILYISWCPFIANNIDGGVYQTAARFTTPFCDNLFSSYYQPNNYLTNSSLLRLITLNSAFKHILMLIKSE